MDNVNRWGSSRRLIAELVVVFLGVYGAFWVENFRDQQDRDERTRKVILALQQDLKDYVEVGGGFRDHIEEGLKTGTRLGHAGKLLHRSFFAYLAQRYRH